MKAAVVTDSTCLIGLERIGRLDLLPATFEVILAPPAVRREFGVPVGWLTTQAPTNIPLVAVLALHLGAGESEAIALAQELGHPLVVDDRIARMTASRLGVSCLGTLAVLVKARRAGLVVQLLPLVDALERNGFFLSAALKAEAL